MALAEKAAQTGEPIVRNMEYSFPNQGFSACKDQFMLGENILVAPMLAKGNLRSVSFPKGLWQAENGKKYKGGKSYEFDVPLEKLLWFRKIK